MRLGLRRCRGCRLLGLVLRGDGFFRLGLGRWRRCVLRRDRRSSDWRLHGRVIPRCRLCRGRRRPFLRFCQRSRLLPGLLGLGFSRRDRSSRLVRARGIDRAHRRLSERRNRHSHENRQDCGSGPTLHSGPFFAVSATRSLAKRGPRRRTALMCSTQASAPFPLPERLNLTNKQSVSPTDIVVGEHARRRLPGNFGAHETSPAGRHQL